MADTIGDEELAEVRVAEIVRTYFKGNEEKIDAWYGSPNPLLGDIAPRDMIRAGRAGKLLKCIENWQAGEMP